MTPLDHAAWELRDLIDRADSMLRRAEDAHRALQRGSPAEAAEILRDSKELAQWIETKRNWALARLNNCLEVAP